MLPRACTAAAPSTCPRARVVRSRASCRIHPQRRYVDPATFAPALQRALHELYALRAFEQVPLERRFGHDVADETFPLHLESVFGDARVGHVLPMVEEIHRLAQIRIPHRL